MKGQKTALTQRVWLACVAFMHVQCFFFTGSNKADRLNWKARLQTWLYQPFSAVSLMKNQYGIFTRDINPWRLQIQALMTRLHVEHHNLSQDVWQYTLQTWAAKLVTACALLAVYGRESTCCAPGCWSCWASWNGACKFWSRNAMVHRFGMRGWRSKKNRAVHDRRKIVWYLLYFCKQLRKYESN